MEYVIDIIMAKLLSYLSNSIVEMTNEYWFDIKPVIRVSVSCEELYMIMAMHWR